MTPDEHAERDSDEDPSPNDPRLWTLPKPPVIPVGPARDVWPPSDVPTSPDPDEPAAA